MDVGGLDHNAAVSRVASAVMKDCVAGWRERAKEERAQREEFEMREQLAGMAMAEEMVD